MRHSRKSASVGGRNLSRQDRFSCVPDEGYVRYGQGSCREPNATEETGQAKLQNTEVKDSIWFPPFFFRQGR